MRAAPALVALWPRDEEDGLHLRRLHLTPVGAGRQVERVPAKAVPREVAALGRAPHSQPRGDDREGALGSVCGAGEGEPLHQVVDVVEVDGVGGVVHVVAGQSLAAEDHARQLVLHLAVPDGLGRVVRAEALEEVLRNKG